MSINLTQEVILVNSTTMLFNSVQFLWFLPLVFILYWLIGYRQLRLQNFLLLIASYVFYGWWDWRFLSLISFSILVDYFAAIRIYHAKDKFKARLWLTLSIIVNIGLLCFFKYYNFFVDSFIAMFAQLGYNMSPWSLNIILPVGISFYTFQTMAYTVDVYKKKIEPCTDFIAFAAFVSFFPQLVAGPIERASRLLPQITTGRKFNYVQIVQGLRLILWGLFKKIVVADSLAVVVNEIFTYTRAASGSAILLAAVFFAFQIYCDFSGYSDIAIGTSKLFGIELMSNFRFPYFSKNLVEFWRRWHISLSTWFRDYVYIPLGGSKQGLIIAVRNIIIVFLLSGLWHGANWTFVEWGAAHALLYVLVFVWMHISSKPQALSNISGNIVVKHVTGFVGAIITFSLVTAAWLLFRAETIAQAVLMFKKMILMVTWPFPNIEYLWYIAALLFFEVLMKGNEREPAPFKSKFIRYLYYSVLIYTIAIHIDKPANEFIYFRF